MSDPKTLFPSLFKAEAHLPIERAAAELRAGRPIVITGSKGPIFVAALDGVSPAVFADFKTLGGAVALSGRRAQMMGLDVQGPIAIPLDERNFNDVFRLAMAADMPAPEGWRTPCTAAAGGIDLCKYALLLPAALIARVPADFADPGDLAHIDANEIVQFLARETHTMELVSEARVPLAGGVDTRFAVFRGGASLRDQVAIVVGKPDPAQPVLVRLHSACLTGDLFGSLRCDCGDQLRKAIAALAAEGGGVLLYLDQEGRGTGIRNKMRAYTLQDEGFDTIEADALLGFDADERRYELAASMLDRLGFKRIRLLTNNPDKIDALTRAGIEVISRRPLIGVVTSENKNYLTTKAHRAGHLLDDMLSQAGSGE